MGSYGNQLTEWTRRLRGMVDPLNINRMADPLDYVRNRNKQYWESYERSLRGEEWDILNPTSGLHFDRSDIIQLILEVTLCILLALLLLELDSLEDLPTYLDAVKQESERKSTV